MNTEVRKADNKAEEVIKAEPQTSVTYVPDVDIIEDRETIRLLADLPGANRENVDITVENNILTIEAQAVIANPEGFQLAGQEYSIGRYHRDFTLSDAVQTSGIRATVKHGVLEVTLPKREQDKQQRRRISIQSD